MKKVTMIVCMAMLVFACAVIAENVKPLDQNQADI